MAAGYVSNYGNVDNDGLTPLSPKRSIQSAKDSGLKPIYINGKFTETVTGAYAIITGNGYAVLDGANAINYAIDSGSMYNCELHNLTARNFITVLKGGYNRTIKFSNCCFIDCKELISGAFQHAGSISDSLIANFSHAFIEYFSRITCYNSTVEMKRFNGVGCANSIYSECQILIGTDMYYSETKFPSIAYSLFHNSTFKFTGGELGNDEADYIAPIGADDNAKLENLRSRMATVYGGNASQYLPGCRYQTDGNLFINPAKENFYLVPGCLATKMSYEAGYVGKYPEGSLADFASNFASYTNIDASGNIIDQTVDASAETNITDLGKLRHINSLEAFGQRATRNGNQVNVDADMGAVVNPGTNLVDGKTYLVHTEAISQTASGKTRDVGETFIATAADGLAFTSDAGSVQEVYLDKPRCIELKASKTDPTLAVTPWVKMDLFKEPRVNYDGNGQIQYGNADAGYNEATSERLFIRYWKARITIKAKNLPS